MDIIDTVFDDLNKELFPGLDKVARHAAMALAVKLSETRGNYSHPGIELERDPEASGTYNRLRKRVPSDFSEEVLLAAGSRIRQYAAGNLAILLAKVCTSLADKNNIVHNSDRPEYEGIRKLYFSLRRLAPTGYTDELLNKIGNNHDVLTYLINGRR